MIGRKVKYSNFSKEDRSKDIKYCIDLLSKARICSLVHHSICSGIPLNAEINENIYKIIFLDIGLVNHICGLDWLTISSYDTLQLINEGYLAEQFIGQHLLYRSKGIHAPEVVYWLREGKTANAEIDYVISQGDYIVPIEVKAGKSGSLKSLFHFVYKKESKLAVRFDLNPPSSQQAEHILLVDNKKRHVSFPLFSLPLYMVEELPRLIDEIRGSDKGVVG
jgi:predicted AAA+ superfamily ATPase